VFLFVDCEGKKIEGKEFGGAYGMHRIKEKGMQGFGVKG
jgi:hypothetical protein